MRFSYTYFVIPITPQDTRYFLMLGNLSRRIQQRSIWLSIICHLLLLLLFTFSWVWHNRSPELKESPTLRIQSYVYQQPITQSSSAVSQEKPLTHPELPTTSADEAVNKNSESGKVAKEIATPANHFQPPNMASEQESKAINISNSIEQVHLIGDKNIDEPLLKLLGRAISAQLVYPQLALDFHLRGTAIIGFNLQPNGQVNHIALLQSSGSMVLDNAALDAIHDASPVAKVNLYLKQAKYIVIGIIFG